MSKSVLCLVALMCLFAGYSLAQFINDDVLIKRLNSRSITWKAKHYDMFEGQTEEDFVATHLSVQVSLEKNEHVVEAAETKLEKELATYDLRVRWPQCLHRLDYVKACGANFAFVAASTFSDRLCVVSHGSQNLFLSPDYILTCDSNNNGCAHGSVDKTWVFFNTTGIPTEYCFPIDDVSEFGSCPTYCKNMMPIQPYTATDIRRLHGVESMEYEIVTNGPVQAVFKLYSDFVVYNTGIYKQTSGKFLGYHSTKIIGWGITEEGEKYWICQNNWSEHWGMDGYFHIAKGNNEVEIERHVYTGTPVTSH